MWLGYARLPTKDNEILQSDWYVHYDIPVGMDTFLYWRIKSQNKSYWIHVCGIFMGNGRTIKQAMKSQSYYRFEKRYLNIVNKPQSSNYLELFNKNTT